MSAPAHPAGKMCCRTNALCDDTEYRCLLRHYGKIQQETSLLCADQAQRIARLEAELSERDTELAMLRKFIQTLMHEADQVICLTDATKPLPAQKCALRM